MERLIIPLITPFRDDYTIDFECMYRHVSRLYKLGVRGFFTPSTTGEIDKISFDEITGIIDKVFGRLKGKYELYIGLKGEYPRVLGREARELEGSYDFTGYIVPAPSYLKYKPEELERFYIMFAGYTDKPIIVYNIPGLTGNLIRPESYIAMSTQMDNIVGTKITFNDSAYLVEVLNLLKENGIDFKVYVGSDPLILTNLLLGGYGVIPGLGNIYPSLYLDLIHSLSDGRLDKAVNLYKEIILKYSEISKEYPFQKAIKMRLTRYTECIKPFMRPPSV